MSPNRNETTLIKGVKAAVPRKGMYPTDFRDFPSVVLRDVSDCPRRVRSFNFYLVIESVVEVCLVMRTWKRVSASTFDFGGFGSGKATPDWKEE